MYGRPVLEFCAVPVMGYVPLCDGPSLQQPSMPA